jgi:hypothetical protein
MSDVIAASLGLSNKHIRAEAEWDNWSLFKASADYISANAALATVEQFASSLCDLLSKEGTWKGLVPGGDADST